MRQLNPSGLGYANKIADTFVACFDAIVWTAKWRGFVQWSRSKAFRAAGSGESENRVARQNSASPCPSRIRCPAYAALPTKHRRRIQQSISPASNNPPAIFARVPWRTDILFPAREAPMIARFGKWFAGWFSIDCDGDIRNLISSAAEISPRTRRAVWRPRFPIHPATPARFATHPPRFAGRSQ